MSMGIHGMMHTNPHHPQANMAVLDPLLIPHLGQFCGHRKHATRPLSLKQLFTMATSKGKARQGQFYLYSTYLTPRHLLGALQKKHTVEIKKSIDIDKAFWYSTTRRSACNLPRSHRSCQVKKKGEH